MSILLDGSTRVLIQGATGRQAREHVPFMQAYGTNIVCGVSPGKGGEKVSGVPVYDTVREAAAHHAVDFSAAFVGARYVRAAAIEAIEGGVPALIIHADGVPLHDAAEILAAAAAHGARVIGPNAQGIVSPGRAKLGGSGGSEPDRVFLPGPVGVLSRSGGMGVEICLDLTRAGIGQSTYVAVGGDPMVGTSFRDLLLLFEHDPETRGVVLFGEGGTRMEEEVAELIGAGEFSKPVVAYVAGEGLDAMPSVMNFGHSRSLLGMREGTVREKREALTRAGAAVAHRLRDIVPMTQEALGGLVAR
jgi:succinyl-CoA synthetase alpha subunit